MNVVDRARLESAVQSYSFWLDLRGLPGRRRRELRRELRTNLVDAAAGSGGARGAVQRLGSTRQMAAETVPVDPTRPRWAVGAQAAIIALALTLMVELLAGLAWVDGVMATEPSGAVSGSMALFPGSSLVYTPVPDGGLSMEFGFGWACLAVALVVLLVVARPWRLLGARSGGRAATCR